MAGESHPENSARIAKRLRAALWHDGPCPGQAARGYQPCNLSMTTEAVPVPVPATREPEAIDPGGAGKAKIPRRRLPAEQRAAALVARANALREADAQARRERFVTRVTRATELLVAAKEILPAGDPKAAPLDRLIAEAVALVTPAEGDTK